MISLISQIKANRRKICFRLYFLCLNQFSFIISHIKAKFEAIMEQLKKVFYKLRILKYAPKENWEWEIYFEEFKDCDLEILKRSLDYIFKTDEEFPKPAKIWRLYNEFLNQQYPISKIICNECLRVIQFRINQIPNECPYCKNKLKVKL